MSTLLELINESAQIEKLLAESEGEITPDLEKAIIVLNENMPTKVDSYAHILGKLDLDAKYWESEADKYYKMAKGCKTLKDRIREQLKFYLSENHDVPLKGNTHEFKLKKSTPSLKIDREQLDLSYFMIIPESIEPDKDKIRDALKAGIDVNGAELLESWALTTVLRKK